MPTPFLNAGVQAKYYDLVSSGRCYMAANSALQALSLNTTTATGLIISNPVTSGVNLVLLQLCVALASAPAAQSNLVLTGNTLTTAEANTTHTTPLTVKNALISGSVSNAKGKVDSAATVPTPAILRAIGGGPVAGSSISPAYIREDLDGIMILAPGTVVSLQAVTTAISVVASIVWYEANA